MSVKHLLYELLWSGSGSVRGNFRGGRKLFPKPSAFESEIHPPHKPSVYALGYFALPGANSRRREFTVRKSRTVFIHATPKDRGMDAVVVNGCIFWKICSNSTGLRRSPFCGCQKATAVIRPNTGIGSQ